MQNVHQLYGDTYVALTQHHTASTLPHPQQSVLNRSQSNVKSHDINLLTIILSELF